MPSFVYGNPRRRSAAAFQHANGPRIPDHNATTISCACAGMVVTTIIEHKCIRVFSFVSVCAAASTPRRSKSLSESYALVRECSHAVPDPAIRYPQSRRVSSKDRPSRSYKAYPAHNRECRADPNLLPSLYLCKNRPGCSWGKAMGEDGRNEQGAVAASPLPHLWASFLQHRVVGYFGPAEPSSFDLSLAMLV